MTKRYPITATILAISIGLTAAGTASAERTFPPQHLNGEAGFSAGTVAQTAVSQAWYHSADSDLRVQRAAAETRQPSPYPSMYYFVNIRNNANDESTAIQAFRADRSG